MLGYAFMAKAHSNAFRKVASEVGEAIVRSSAGGRREQVTFRSL